MQTAIVFLLVAGSAVYAVWALLPQRLKRRIAGGLANRMTSQAASRRLRAIADRSTGCHCGDGGCGTAAPKPPAEVQPIRIVRRPGGRTSDIRSASSPTAPSAAER